MTSPTVQGSDIWENDSNEESENVVASWRFSKSESKTIDDMCQQYLQAHDLDQTALLSYLKVNTDTSRTNRTFWTMLEAALPHRSREAIYRKTRTLLMRKEKPIWTPDDKATLMALVEIHGQDWKVIGKTMGRVCSDVKTTYRNNIPRKITGRFSEEEDEALLIQIITHCKIDPAVEEMPILNIPWTDIARSLNNDRQPNDYRRRWLALRPKIKYTHSVKPANAVKKLPSSSSKRDEDNDDDEDELVAVNNSPAKLISTIRLKPITSRNMSDTELLEHLETLDAEDESEINFAYIDLQFNNMSKNYATQRWAALKKSCPTHTRGYIACVEYLISRSRLEQSSSAANNDAADIFTTAPQESSSSSLSNARTRPTRTRPSRTVPKADIQHEPSTPKPVASKSKEDNKHKKRSVVKEDVSNEDRVSPAVEETLHQLHVPEPTTFHVNTENSVNLVGYSDMDLDDDEYVAINIKEHKHEKKHKKRKREAEDKEVRKDHHSERDVNNEQDSNDNTDECEAVAMKARRKRLKKEKKEKKRRKEERRRLNESEGSFSS